MSQSSLIDVFKHIFVYVLWLKRNCASTQPAYNEVRSKILAMLEATAWAVREHNIDPRDYDDARFAICVWIDETCMNMGWVHQDEWLRSLLQMELYKSARGGDEFFDRLNQLAPHQNEVREVYYFCLSLGLTGRFCHEGDEMLLEQLKRASQKMIAGESLSPMVYQKRAPFREAYVKQAGDGNTPGKTIKKTDKWSPAKTWLISVPPAVFGIVYVVYFLVLEGVSDTLITRVVGG
ncbi:MAG: DotU family type IV/VI secretion system protein [Gammaproteobacteria bacterium]|nr:DotU family type IV/VI secretion system protein [Gammaproteobacteria bacterium]MDH5694492.1 DotU family type IV/VI secretion system protein [Gammaproteobacteria bacterium]